MIEDANCHDYVIRRDGRIVASVCLCVAHSTEQTIGFVESLVVSSAVRGQGLGRELMQHVIAQAPPARHRLTPLHIQARPRRSKRTLSLPRLSAEGDECVCDVILTYLSLTAAPISSMAWFIMERGHATFMRM